MPEEKKINVGAGLAGILFVGLGIIFLSQEAMGLGLILFFIGLFCLSKIS